MTLQSVVRFGQRNTYLGISDKSYGRTCFAKKNFNIGEVVVMGIGRIIDHQTSKVSIQIGLDKHFLPTKWTGRYWNHSCEPNTYVKTRSDEFPNLVALQRIKCGDEITYSYAMTEYSWCRGAEERVIACKCKSKKCKSKILSFSQLSKSEQKTLVKHRVCAAYLNKLA